MCYESYLELNCNELDLDFESSKQEELNWGFNLGLKDLGLKRLKIKFGLV